jgi:hypothetical protein
MINIFEIYLNDLTPAARDRLELITDINKLNANYPIATLDFNSNNLSDSSYSDDDDESDNAVSALEDLERSVGPEVAASKLFRDELKKVDDINTENTEYLLNHKELNTLKYCKKRLYENLRVELETITKTRTTYEEDGSCSVQTKKELDACIALVKLCMDSAYFTSYRIEIGEETDDFE